MKKVAEADVADCDVLVIGGGPAGTTIATVLAEKGWQVTLLEKAHHPRFHIGESLLPMNLPILERLGVLEQVQEIGVIKYGAEFNSMEYQRRQTFYFGDAIDKNHPHAYEVTRSEFDHILFKNCRAKGVDAHEGVKVTHVDFRPGQTHRITALDDNKQEKHWQARFIIDASGRDTLLARHFDWKTKNPRHNSAAIFGHFKQVERRAGKDEGNISIYWFDHGWFWMIPLRSGVMSVGAVCWPEYLKKRKTDTDTFLWDTIKRCPEVAQRMEKAELIGKANATGNYTYRSRKMYGDGYLLVGDAFAFLDPVFSSGVYLAMTGAEQGAEVVDAWLREAPDTEKQFLRYAKRMDRGLRTVSWFIYRFTSPAMHKIFMESKNNFRIKEAVISMLAGDVFGKTPIKLPLLLFKIVYYSVFVSKFQRARRNYLLRKRNVDERFSGGTTPVDVD